MNRAEFATVAAAMRNYYPKEQLFTTPEMIALWYEALADLSAKSVESTLREWVKTHNWSPKIAEIRTMAAAHAEGRITDLNRAAELGRAIEAQGFDTAVQRFLQEERPGSLRTVVQEAAAQRKRIEARKEPGENNKHGRRTGEGANNDALY